MKKKLEITIELGDKRGGSQAYCNLGNVYLSLGDFTKAIEYHNLFLEITKEIGDKHGEVISYGGLANDYRSLGNLIKAIDFCI